MSAQGEFLEFQPLTHTRVSDSDVRREIDAMSYEDALRKVVVAPLTDPMFRGEIGRYFHAALKQKRHDTPPEERTAAAERITASLK